MEEAIIRAARTVFLRDGYNASTEAIIREAGIARQTLYNHFKTKNALLKAVIDHLAWETMRPFLTLNLGLDVPLPEALRRFGETYMEAMLHPDQLGLVRLISTAGGQYPDVAKIAQQAVRSIPVLTSYLRAQADAGNIRCAAPDLVAESFFGALVGPARFRYMLGMNISTSPAEKRAYVREIVDLYVEGLHYRGAEKAKPAAPKRPRKSAR